MKTGPQYACQLFETEDNDAEKYSTVFETRIAYTKNILERVKDWVAANIDRWTVDKPDWFKIEMIPDNLLPDNVFEAEGGHNRKRITASIREMIGGIGSAVDEQQSRRVRFQLSAVYCVNVGLKLHLR